MAVAVGSPRGELRLARHPPFRMTSAGLVARVLAALGLFALVFALPLLTTQVWANLVSLAAIYGIIGLSVNINSHVGRTQASRRCPPWALPSRLPTTACACTIGSPSLRATSSPVIR